MFSLSNVSIAPLRDSRYVKPMEVHYTLNGSRMKWDIIQANNSVSVIIFNITRKVFVLVRQFRPAVYIDNIPPEDRQDLIDCNKYPVELGLTLEFCAGMCDKNKSVEQIAKEEVFEETGYDVPIDKLEKIRAYNSAVGRSAGKTHLFYVEVEDHMKVEKGGGLAEEGEYIEIVELPLLEAKKLNDDSNSPLTPTCNAKLLYGLLWFFCNKASKFGS